MSKMTGSMKILAAGSQRKMYLPFAALVGVILLPILLFLLRSVYLRNLVLLEFFRALPNNGLGAIQIPRRQPRYPTLYKGVWGALILLFFLNIGALLPHLVSAVFMHVTQVERVNCRLSVQLKPVFFVTLFVLKLTGSVSYLTLH